MFHGLEQVFDVEVPLGFPFIVREGFILIYISFILPVAGAAFNLTTMLRKFLVNVTVGRWCHSLKYRQKNGVIGRTKTRVTFCINV